MNMDATENLRRFSDKSALSSRGAGIGIGLIGMLVLPLLVRALGTSLMMRLGLMDSQKYSAAYSYLQPEVYYIYYSLLYLSMVLVPFLILVPIYRRPGSASLEPSGVRQDNAVGCIGRVELLSGGKCSDHRLVRHAGSDLRYRQRAG